MQNNKNFSQWLKVLSQNNNKSCLFEKSINKKDIVNNRKLKLNSRKMKTI